MPTTTPASRARGRVFAPACDAGVSLSSALSASARTAFRSVIMIEVANITMHVSNAARSILESCLRIRFNPDRLGRLILFRAQQRATEDIDCPALDGKRRKAQEAEHRHLKNLDAAK